MNTSHYPSLELCKKLTANGFPKTEKCWTRSLKWDEESKTFPYELSSRPTPGGYYFAASVMELLDEMPYILSIGSYTTVLTIKKVSDKNSNICYTYKHFETGNFNGPLPNALAEMYLFLKENGYIGK